MARQFISQRYLCLTNVSGGGGDRFGPTDSCV